jgi:hypothetical protein
MRALILNDELRREIRRVVEHARANPVPLSTMKEIAAGRAPAVGYDQRFACEIPVGYRAVFSIEEHPGGWMRHLSISVAEGKLPHPAAIAEIMKEFGFAGGIGDCERWVENTEDARAVNLVEPLDPPLPRPRQP